MKNVLITKKQYNMLCEEILYRASSQSQAEDERNGVWLSDEPDTNYGRDIHEYDVDLSSLNLASEDVVKQYIDKFGQDAINDYKYSNDIDDDNIIDSDYEEVMTDPHGWNWNSYLKEDGYDGYIFNYDGYKYYYIYDPGKVRRIK